MATIITKTIGQDGWQDFSAIQQATDAITTSDVANTADLVTADVAVVFEIYAGVYSESVTIAEGLTCDATRNVTYKPAAGSEHGGSRGAGVKLVSNVIGSNALDIQDDFIIIDGIEIAFEGLITDTSLTTKVTNGAVGVVYKNCIMHANGAREVLRIGQDAAGSAAHPIEVLNCIIDASQTNARPAINSYASTGNDVYTKIINNTINGHINQPAINLGGGGANKVHEVRNNISFNRAWSAAGTTVVTGSDNIGPDVAAFPSTLQAESQTWTFTTDRTAASTGSQVVYDANDFSLINVAGNDAIGVGTATGVPTTDINGVDRVRGVGTQYVDPGAFTSDLFTYTRTIGPGRHYDDFGEAESAITTIPRDTNLAQQNLAIVFEADAGDYSENLSIFTNGGITCDSTRNVTFKAAAGSEHGGNFESGVNIIGSCGANESFAVVDGLSVTPSTGTAASIGLGAVGAILRNLMSYSTNSRGVQLGRGGTAANPCVIENCVAKTDTSKPFDIRSDGAAQSHCRVVNCTAMATGINQGFMIGQSSTGNTIYLELVNNVVHGGTARSYFELPGVTINVTGSNNAGPDDGSSPFPAAVQAGSQTWTTTTDTTAASTGSQIIYTSATGELVNVSGNDVIGVGTASAAPTTDINGVSRIRGASNEYVDPGAFSVDKITYTRTIGKDGWQDYDEFTDAEAAKGSIAYDTNFAQRNLAVVFEAYAGLYTGNITDNDAVTADSERNISYVAAAGQEHGGDYGAGVRVQPSGQQTLWFWPQSGPQSFTKLKGLNMNQSRLSVDSNGILRPDGIVIDSCIVAHENNTIHFEGGTETNPHIIQNSILEASGSGQAPIIVRNGNGVNQNTNIINNYIKSNSRVLYAQGSHLTNRQNLKVYNNVFVGANPYFDLATVTPIIEGGGNLAVSSALYPLPNTVLADNQTWTFTTDTTASSTGSQVIYDDTTGALVNVSGNDAVGVGTGTQAPTTDINGVSRIRGADDEYADPGAFTTSLKEIVRSVGSTSRDYETLTLAKNAAEGLSTNLNLAQRNEKIIFEFYDDGTPQYATTIDTNLISDPERHVQYKNAPGQDVRITHTAGSYLNMQIKDSFTHWSLGTSNNGVDHRLWVVSDSNNLETKGVVIENCTLSSTTNTGAGINFRLEGDAQQIGSMGTKKHPHIVRNARFFTRGFSQIGGGPKGSFLKIKNCTFAGIIAGHAPGNVINYNRANQHVVPEDLIEIRNCVNLDSAAGDANIAAGFSYYQGSNNVGGANGQFNFKFSYLGMGTDFTSTSSVDASSTGTQVIYDASGRLVNVSGNDAVGFGDGSYAPSADINGTPRLRGANNEYADPGAFTTDLVSISNTISEGTAVADIQQAFNDIDDNIQTQINSYNLAKRNATYSLMFEPGTYDLDDGSLFVPSTLTGDLNRRVTITCTPGGEHGGDVSGGVLLRQRGFGNSVIGFEDDTTLKNIAIERYDDAYNRHTLMPRNEKRVLIENVIAWNNTSGTSNSFIYGNTDEGAEIILSAINCKTINMQYMAWGNTTPTKSLDFTVKNCVMYSDNGAGTAISRTNGDLIVGFKSLKLYNNVGINVSATAQLFTSHQNGRKIYMEGAGNVVTNRGSLTANAFLAESQTWTFSTDAAASSTGSQAIYDASTYALVNVSGNDAVGVGDGTNAPTTDIAGNSRIRGLNDDYADPGAYTTDKITILKRVADLGYQNSESQYDYGSLRDVYDNVVNDALSDDQSRSNLAQRNYELVYEFRAGEYTGADNRSQTIPTNNLIFGPTNRLIFRPEQGSEHNGDFDKGVRFFGTGYSEVITFYPNNPDGILFADWEGMVTKIDDATPAGRLNVVIYRNDVGAAHCGGSVKNCLDRSTFTSSNNDRHFVGGNSRNTIGSKKYPILVENNVSIRPGSCIFKQDGGNNDHAAFIKATNNTFICRWFLARNNYYDRVYPGTLELEQNNNILIPSSEIEGAINNYYLETVTLQGDEDFYEGTTKITGKNNYSFTGVVQDVDNIGSGRNYKSVEIPGSLKGSIYPVNYTTDTTSTSADTFIYDANNLSAVNVSGNALIGLGDSSLAPSADILSASRIRPSFGAEEVGPDYSEPGAFSTELSTITKTIGPDGDFSGFSQAESALFNDTSIIYERNLSKANLAVVVEVEAGRYTENLDTYNANFYGGPTNTVTYRAAAGSEHNGLVDSGVRLGRDAGVHSSTAASINLPYQILEGLVLLSNATNYANAVVTITSTNRRAEGIKIKNCIFSCSENIDGYAARVDCNATDRPRGTEEHPIVFDNCVFLKTGIQSVRIGNGADANAQFNNCTFGEGRTTARVAASIVDGGKTYKVSWTNCIKLVEGADVSYTPGSDTTLVAGPSNLSLHTGPSDTYWPGSLTYTATTDTSAASTGNQMIYDASTLALVNVSGNDAVGVGTGSAITVPANDILGNSRIRGANNEYADPGAFSVDTITTTKTIGIGGAASGFDFDSFTEAEAAVDTTAIVYDSNLAQRNLAVVFEANAGTYSELGTVYFDSQLITDATRNVTYKPANGAEHGGDESAGVIVQPSTGATPFDVRDNFTVLDGLVMKGTAVNANGIQTGSGSAEGVRVKNCIIVAGAYPLTLYGGGTAANPISVQSCVAKGLNTAPVARLLGLQRALFAEISNCTLLGGGTGVETNSHSFNADIGLVNNLRVGNAYSEAVGSGALTVTGSNNVGGSGSPFPSLLQAESQTWTFSTDTTASSTGNQVIYTSATGELVNVSGNDAVGIGTATGVPATDINGVSRLRGANNEYADPGAFTTDLLTFNRKIGPYREYTTFGDAEADVVAISTDGNLAQRNEAIVFEADAGTYAQSVTFQSSLNSDATRNVTYKAGAGSEHGGLPTSGVRLESPDYDGTKVYEAFTAFDGIVFRPTNVGTPVAVTNNAAGVSYRNVIFSTPATHLNGGIRFAADFEGLTAPIVLENCVVISAYISMHILANTAYSFVINNCTATGRPAGASYFILREGSTPTISVTANNNSALLTNPSSRFVLGSGITWAGTASNVALADVPSALQAEGQHWTFTTDTTASPTGSQVIYDSDTGKLVNVSGNDAIGVGTASSAPTTDINGTSRLRGVGTQYADPGAFTSEINTITKTIGIGGAASGFDFADITEAEAALIANSVTYSREYAEKNIAVVFEISPGLYTDNFNVGLSNHGFGPGNSVTFQKAQDEVPVFKPTANLYFAVPFGTLDGIELNSAENSGQNLLAVTNFGEDIIGTTIKNCSFKTNTFATCLRPFMSTAGAGEGIGTSEYPLTVANCYFDGQYGVVSYTSPTWSGSYYVDVINCAFDYTFGGPGQGQHYGVDLVASNDNVGGRGRVFNSIDYVPDAYTGTAFNIYSELSGEYTGNYSVNAFNPNNSASVITATTDITASSTGNQAIYVSSTGALVNVSGNDMIGASEGSAINVPVTDILGKSRLRGLSNEYVDPGAYTTDIKTTTLTANPGTLSSLILNLTPYITTTNIAKRNESIVIELEKADYPEFNFTNLEDIIGDSVRNITIKPQEGAYHKGIRGAGIRFITANTGYDTFGIQDASGFTIEGVEFYAPSGDIGRYLTVTRNSEATTYKDVIFNNVEKPGMRTMQSWYGNGKVSPLSFRNCLFITEEVCISITTLTDEQIQGKYELTNCTLSSLNASRPAIQFDCFHDGTFEVNLTNNLFLGTGRNIGNRWIGQTGGFAGDAFFYGSNNTGPDTPNYQLPTAIRASIYPILPTTDYTPVPADPAAVYKPKTLQLLDIPNNDAVGLGVGTENPLVPAQGIGGEARSTSSCNPGCWESQYELVDLQLNTLRGVEGFRNVFKGPSTNFAHAVLPDDTVPVFIVVGDSTAQGFSNTPDDNGYRETTISWPDNAFDGSAYGYFWDKYMSTSDNGVTWTRPYPDFINPSTSGTGFVPLNPRMGGIGVGSFTYADPVGTPTQVGGCSPIWDFAVDISGIFRNSAGETLAPHFIFIAVTGSRLGSDGPPGPGTTEFNFSPSGGYLYNTLIESYVKPAVDDIMNNAKNPLLVGSIVLHGGTEAKIDYNPNPNGNKVSASGVDTYANFLRGIQDDTKIGGIWPYMFYAMWQTLPDGSTAQTDYPKQYTDAMNKALSVFHNVHINRMVNLVDLLRDKTEAGDPAIDGIHFLQRSYPRYGQRFGDYYRSLLSMNKYPIYGRTLSDIFDE